MKILVSFRGELIGPGMADIFRRDERVARADVASDPDSVVEALLASRYDIHVVGGSCMPIALEIGRRHKEGSLALYVPDQQVMVAIDPDPMEVLEARRLGFTRVVEPVTDILDRLLAPIGSSTWMEDDIGNFPVGDVTNLGEVCRDEVDRRIIALIVEGWSDTEIADKMNYAVQSVRNRVSRMLQVSGFRNRTELAVKMVRRVQRL